MCKTSSYIAGIISGAAVGMAVLCAMGNTTGKNKYKKAIKAKAGKAVKKFSDMIDDMM